LANELFCEEKGPSKKSQPVHATILTMDSVTAVGDKVQ